MTEIHPEHAALIIDQVASVLAKDGWLESPAAWADAAEMVAEAARVTGLVSEIPRRVVWTAADGVLARITVPADAWTIGAEATVLSLDGDLAGEFVSSRVLGVTGTDAEGPDAGSAGGRLQAAADALWNAAAALEATDE